MEPQRTTYSTKKPTLRRARKADDKAQTSTVVEAFSKISSPLLTAVGLLIGLWQFREQQKTNETQEFRRKVWDLKMQAYNELSKATSIIMTSAGSADFDSLSVKYKQTYWSTMPLFDKTVETYMSDFDEEINSVKNNEGDPSVLRNRGYNLLKACRSSLDSSFNNVSR